MRSWPNNAPSPSVPQLTTQIHYSILGGFVYPPHQNLSGLSSSSSFIISCVVRNSHPKASYLPKTKRAPHSISLVSVSVSSYSHQKIVPPSGKLSVVML
ncbi:uncharacterized protein LOC110428921 isoform X2 [Herrania umbratica]|uniref:Uncharacterized protein LOC110428921 isoform X2 n=1 Tax=Herrania umbratica TaxID=108875 RepID=A0A6J1BN41_9ROSI|nr:uncharacterized protein LOC110428921 isoform X2 [Herrania umbratica]